MKEKIIDLGKFVLCGMIAVFLIPIFFFPLLFSGIEFLRIYSPFLAIGLSLLFGYLLFVLDSPISRWLLDIKIYQNKLEEE